MLLENDKYTQDLNSKPSPAITEIFLNHLRLQISPTSMPLQSRPLVQFGELPLFDFLLWFSNVNCTLELK